MILRKMYDDGCKVTVEGEELKWSDVRERVASLANDLQSKSLELQTMQGLVTEAA